MTTKNARPLPADFILVDRDRMQALLHADRWRRKRQCWVPPEKAEAWAALKRNQATNAQAAETLGITMDTHK